MPDNNDSMDDAFLKEVKRSDDLVRKMLFEAIDTHVDAYPFVLQLLNTVLVAGQVSNSIGGSEPNTLNNLAIVIKAWLEQIDPPSAKFITVH